MGYLGKYSTGDKLPLNTVNERVVYLLNCEKFALVSQNTVDVSENLLLLTSFFRPRAPATLTPSLTPTPFSDASAFTIIPRAKTRNGNGRNNTLFDINREKH
ncbi:hypothetical protein PUN28_015256 [Cardiocondyla obscurior]|uniref:Uncharacterized protein n=1 Tax=Cardiocondyla obscurior TaxID=286306 RepID=A0AAW2F377_9HYME